MPASIECVCHFQDDQHWHCQWTALTAEARVDRRVEFSAKPAEFIGILNYLGRVHARPAVSVPRPELEAVQLRLRYRRNAQLFELQVHSENESLRAMVDEPQLARLVRYHESCLQALAVAIYEGRVPIPEGYPDGYPEPRWG